ncbi:10015_t:CDS:2 [Cetraspora pellucida]|uniref:10015_t:CDS:1 n=1 Tax=Cetraspora pellucida TaxID=1433469 RepID=A0ACA9KX75_9GLOM|nr:10015_t:CDS:2 [Cetraspora pellucida]
MIILIASANSKLYQKNKKISGIIYQLPHIGKVCHNFFQAFWLCGRDVITHLCNWIRECQSMLPKLYGNIGRHLKNILSVETVNKAKLFIKSLGEQHDEQQAIRKYTHKKINGQITVNYEKVDIILLPSHYSYDRFLVAYNSMNSENHISSRWTFQKLWKNNNELSKIIIKKPSKDVCDECILYKHALKESDNKTDEDLDEQLITHISDYREMRKLYEDDVQEAKNCDRFSLHVHQFGLVDKGIDRHWHAIYSKGKALKGSNEVASILHQFLVSTAEIKYQFQIKRHTRNSVDRGFGRTKIEYVKSEAWCINHLAEIINRSADNNIAINLDEQTELFYDWISALGKLYRKLPAIQKYHLFQFSYKKPGLMKAKKILAKDLLEQKQFELWDKIRKYCPAEFQNILCPKPSDDVINRAKKQKGANTKKAQNKNLEK